VCRLALETAPFRVVVTVFAADADDDDDDDDGDSARVRKIDSVLVLAHGFETQYLAEAVTVTEMVQLFLSQLYPDTTTILGAGLFRAVLSHHLDTGMML
jgi:hypothetical protein